MDIKQFQKGQSAYMLKENHGYSKPPDSHEQNSKYFVQEFPHMGRKGFSNHAMICSFIVMKCEGFSMVSDLVDYLYNNLLIAHYCGFDIFQNVNPFPVFRKGTLQRFPLAFLLGFASVGHLTGNGFPVYQGGSGALPDFVQHKAVKGFVFNAVLCAVVLAAGVVRLTGINLLRVFVVSLGTINREMTRRLRGSP